MLAENMLAFSTSSSIKGSVKKVKLVADLVRGMDVFPALEQLKFCNKRLAYDFILVLRSAIANADNNFGYDIDKLYISAIVMGKALTLKRMSARAKGRGARILKRYSRISIYVNERSD